MRNGQIVRKPFALPERSARTIDQRLLIRFPWLARPWAGVVSRLSPSSRLRQALVWRAFERATEALNRRDMDAALISYGADRELNPAREWVEAGFVDPSYTGPDAFRRYLSDLDEVWGTTLRIEPVELIDLGDRLVMLATLPSRAQSSGVALTSEYATVMTFRRGEIVRQRDYMSHKEALEAAGIPPLPSPAASRR